MIEILHLFISPGHNFYGHHAKAPGEHPTVEVTEIECIAGRGISGDRFLDYKADYKGQITFFAYEVYDELRSRFGVSPSPGSFRRNVITRGVDLNTLIGQQFEIQGVLFEGSAECTPCHWMDQAFHPGAHEALKGRGGLRARILTDGLVRVSAKSDA
jgi:MOSC domain-containing protein YiiM